MGSPSESQDKFMLRFKLDGQREQLKALAAEEGRTLNGQILFLIKKGMEAAYGKRTENA
ncbi:hypothetical protein [Chitinibacter tainanensis]|uniref:ribbon-helix-helix domain-containing protein n=1 Tax=Chitinibacter tainanensis TaxID=230667 RepID=UPI0023551525|nr:hypothetical protein [Chitinibacter tainanensis]